MKKALYIIGILFVVIIVVPLIAGMLGDAAINIMATVYTAAILASPFVLIGALIFHRKRSKKQSAEKVAQDGAPRQAPPPQVQHVKVTKSAAIPQHQVTPVAHEPDGLDIDEDDDDIAYRYKNVGVFVPYTDVFNHPALVEGAIVSLRQEPENTYDHRAVAVVIGRKRIGYLFRGKLQDMANDWLERGDAVSGRVVRVDPNAYDAKNNAVKINLYFYN